MLILIRKLLILDLYQRKNMVKLFVGNLGDIGTITSNDLRELFEKYGSVSKCERVKNYAFVHMVDLNAAQDALHDLNGKLIQGKTVPRQ